MKQETIATHFGYDTKQGTGDMAVPLHMTTAYDFGDTTTAANRFALKELGVIYSRITNPTVQVLENRFAEFEGGAAAISVSSGQTALFYIIANLAEAGDNVLIAKKVYGGSVSLVAYTMKRFGIEARFFDSDNADDLEALIDDKTKMIFFESISNPQISIPNIEKIVKIAQKHKVMSVVDNTVATSVLFDSFKHGLDVAMYSATKYIGGQGYVMGGLISTRKNLNGLIVGNKRYSHFNEPDESYHGLIYADLAGMFDIFTLRMRLALLRDIGAVLSPHSAFGLIQGLETLNLRMKKHCENAIKVAEFLNSHPKIKSINYPSLKNDKYHEKANKYLKNGFASGLLSFNIGDKETAVKFINSLKLFSIVVNIGDSKSIVTHPASTTHSQLSESELNKVGIGGGDIRISVGIEDANDLIADLKQALDNA